MTTENENAYAAGFMDGEGSISTRNQRGSLGNRILLVKICQKDTRPLFWLKRNYGGSVWVGKNGKGRIGVWSIYRKPAIEFLMKLKPYLQVKKERAILAMTIKPEELRKIPSRNKRPAG